MPSPLPPRLPAALADGLRADLAAGYTRGAVEDALGPVATAALQREEPVAARRATDGVTEAAAVLTRLFLLGEPVTRAELDTALPRTTTAGATAVGLVTAAGEGDDDEVRAAVDLRPYEASDAAGEARWWLASDLGELATGRSLHADHVLGIGGASLTLARITVRDHRPRVLDLGTGCGVQALHASRHAEHVLGTDVSRRALDFAAFNAALAGTPLELREGSLLEPVGGQRFDLVVSNPPFVITPPAAHAAGLPVMEYRDGARPGDSLVADLVSGLGGHLAPGGVAQLLGNWEHHAGEDWRERVGGWLEAAGTDGWVVQREVQDPAEYAHTWLRDGGLRPGSALFDAVLSAWLDDFAARGVEAVGFGYLVLRRPADESRPRWRRVEELTSPVQGPLGGHVAHVLAAQEWLAATDDAALAAQTFQVAEDVTEERHLRPGEPDPRVLLLRQGGGFGRTYRPGTLVAGAVGACDGELTLGQIVGGLAVVLDQPADAVAAEVLPAVRELVLDGLLVPGPY
ncbi:methyltransferase [Georgenia satyanarayanai]|uniref:DUF7059 domain-containing protein n=1 Tax=Georgenia satyanarayanai TaxID=860221 RepID=UPI00203C3610|nr:methyltransferase [Georgenia satyanarayanai]MCM3662554.1 methyltransferase [Georgenia satyanarayanai]